MGKKIEIKCISYVHDGDRLVRFEDLTDSQRAAASQELLARYMNELYRGQAVFTPNEQGCPLGSYAAVPP